ncbi:MAG TPA: S8 family serine peptidase [Flavobacterium sp.]|nr:S8 family serine peptidase [Flavobacterium sp.]
MKQTVLFLLFAFSSAFGQTEDAWVYFTDKPNAQTFFNNPLSELTQRSLDRRTTQNIALDIKDAPLHAAYVNQITATSGITVLAKSKWLNALHIQGTQANIAALGNLAFVNRIQYANHSLNPGGRMAPKEGKTTKTNKWLDTQENFAYGNSAAQVQMLNCHILHQQSHTGEGKIVAIMDAGFPGVNTALPFKRLRDNGLILGGYDFVNNSTNFYTGNSHGTMVLSTMGGYATNLVGTAPDAHYYLFITENVASESPLEETNWIEAAEEADRLGVDVINTSLGYFDYDNASYSYTYAHMNGTVSVMARAVDIAFSRGMICVTSAGNSGASAEPHIATPADAALNVTVGSVTSAEVKSGFSSIGPSADGRIKPDLMAMGSASVLSNTSGTITTNNGTSFSSPILAGAITSFWSAFPNKTNAQIVQLVKSSADRYSTPNNNYGYGIPDFQAALGAALSSDEFEFGKIKMYPNPVKDVVTIDLPEQLLGAKIVIYNAFGQKIKEEQILEKNQRIAMHNLNSGVYIYTILNSGSSVSGKLIKQ